MTAGDCRTVLMAFAMLLVFSAIGCARSSAPTAGRAFCADPVETTRHELFFGLKLPDSSTVSEREFTTFANEIVGTLFPEGFTVLDASGRYQMADGTRIDESTKLLILVYPDITSVTDKIRRIIAEYRTRFRQESVGWVRSAARVCF